VEDSSLDLWSSDGTKAAVETIEGPLEKVPHWKELWQWELDHLVLVHR
jgi:hypothetical protein